LEFVHALIKFYQGKDVFILDFVATIKISQINLFMMYIDPMTNYQHEHFQVFCAIVENTSTIITQDWVTNLKIGS
jgi:hypothetical protein